MYGLVDGVFPCGRGFEEKPDPAEQASDGAGWESRDAGHTKATSTSSQCYDSLAVSGSGKFLANSLQGSEFGLIKSYFPPSWPG